MNVEGLRPALEDERGSITNVGPGVAVIFCRKGSVRSNHFHKRGWHHLYVVSGRMVYAERYNGNTVVRSVLPGERVFTGPGIPHRTEFPVDTVLVSMGPTSNNDIHEDDLVRLEWP